MYKNFPAEEESVWIRKKQISVNSTGNDLDGSFLQHSQWFSYGKDCTSETFQQSGYKDFLRHILKSSASMYESSGSQFFRTTTGIQSGPDAFDGSRLAMTFLTLLSVMEIICSFRLVLDGKTGEEIPRSSRSELLDKFLGNNFHLSDAENNIPSCWAEQVEQIYLAENSISRLPQVSKVKFLGSDELFCFCSICAA